MQVDSGFLVRRCELEEAADPKGFLEVWDFAQSVFEFLDFNQLFHPNWCQVLLTQ